MPIWDVAIVGAGPAGSAAALGAVRARPDARVLLLDKAAFPRDKACGDGIAPHALDVLAGLGVDVAAVTDGYPPVDLLELRAPSGAAAVRTMRRPARVIPRRVLDARLVDAALARGVELARRTVRRVEVRDDRVVLDGEVAARVVVGADGANSLIRQAIGLRARGDGVVALGLRAYAPAPDGGRPAQRILMADQRWPAYAWSFPIGDGSANVGYGEVLRDGRAGLVKGWRRGLLRGGAAAGGAEVSRALLLERLHALLPELDAREVRDARAHHLPFSTATVRQPDGRVLLAGDALSLVNPMTGEGIFYAVRSGALAGAAAGHGGAAGAAYRRAVTAALGRHLRSTAATALLSTFPATVDAGIRASAADQRVFDDMVELGLGEGTLTPRALAAVAGRVALRRRR
jgi:geranylgeranyl reductase family protein